MINADRFQVGRRADASWGAILYRGATAIALLILVLAIGNCFYNMSQSRPLIPLIPLMAAGVIWLVGYGLRFLLSDR